MTNLLTTVSGYFSRSLILGAFLPVVIAVALFALAIFPLIPDNAPFIASLMALETEWKVVSASFVTIILSGLIHNLNNPIIRSYEGYPWRNTKFGRWKTKQHVEEFNKLQARQRGMRATLLAMDRTDNALKPEVLKSTAAYLKTCPSSISKKYSAVVQDDFTDELKWKAAYSAILGGWTTLNRFIIASFPNEDSLILPTRLGNVIRSFEVYPLREYGMDSIVLYPRLISQIDKDYAVIIDEAKTSFDFMINCSLLAVILLLALISTGVYYGEVFVSEYTLAAFLFTALLLLLISYLAYLGAINRAADWGQTVKSSFDLYRNDLLKQLGYNSALTGKEKERAMWMNISRQILDGDSLKGPRIEYAEKSVSYPSLSAESGDEKIDILRDLDKSDTGGLTVVMIVTNEDKQNRAVNLTITDKLPEGWFYRHDTARLTKTANKELEEIRVTGSNPYRFQIGTLEPGQQKKLAFEILKLPEKEKS